METTSPREMAKLAAKAIRGLRQENTKLAAANAEANEKLAHLMKERECFTVARQMAEAGLSDCSAAAVEKLAKSLMAKDLAVVKEAMHMAVVAPSFGEPHSGGTVASGEDVLVEAILSLAQ